MVDIASIQDIERLLEAHKAQILAALDEKLKGNKSGTNSKWIRSWQLKELISVSDSTLTNYRKAGILKSKKIRGSHFYLKADVLKLMENDK